MRDHDDHLSDRDLVLAVDGELPPKRQAAAEAHLIGCAACAERRARVERVSGVVVSLHEHAVAIDSIEGSRRQLRSKLTAIADADRGSPGWGLPQWAMAGAAVIAAIVLVRVVHPLYAGSTRSAAPAIERDALPRASLTPGATWNISVDELCAAGGREQRPIAADVRAEVLRGYGMERVAADEYELDYLITPELGGAPDALNLWPQRYGSRVWNAHVKDQLERLLPRLVCDGTVPLQTAQRDIAADWVAAYRKYFRTEEPLRAHAAALDERVDEGPITYPVWRAPTAPALKLISFSAAP